MQSGTWGTYVADVQRSKLVCSIPAAPFDLVNARTSAVTRSKGFGRGTVFNPVLGSWADSNTETQVRHAAEQSEVVRGNRARDRQLKHVQAFDLLNARPLVTEEPARGQRETTETYSSRVPYNILSSLPLPDVLLTARARDPQRAARAQMEPPRPLINSAPSLVRRRGIDIISNKYVHDHDARQGSEQAAQREHALRRYWQTRNFDPLRQVYEDGAKDAAYEEDVRLSQSIQGVAQRERLPPSIRLSLGSAYDIVAHAPKDVSVVELVDTMESRPLRRMQGRVVEERLVAEGKAHADLWESRRLKAMRGATRVTTLADPRGFNIATSAPIDPAHMRSTLEAGRMPSAWERIQHGLGGGGGGDVGAGAGAAAAAGWGEGGG